jgi:hypothetical protein
MAKKGALSSQGAKADHRLGGAKANNRLNGSKVRLEQTFIQIIE